MKIYKEIKHKISIKYKAMLIICSTTLVITVAGISLGYFLGYSVLRSAVREKHIGMAKLLAVSVSMIIDKQIEQIKAYATDEDCRKSIRESNLKYQNMEDESIQRYLTDADKEWVEAPGDSPLVNEYLSNEASVELKVLLEKQKKIAEIFITDRFGALAASSGRTSDFYQADEGWWQEAYHGGKGNIYIGDIGFDESSNVLAVVFAVPLTDKTGEVIGICKTVVDLSSFLESLEGFKIGKTGHAALIDKNGYILFHQDIKPLSMRFSSKDDLQKIFENKNGWGILDNPYLYKERIFFSFAEIDNPVLLKSGLTWRILVEQGVKEVFAPLNKLIFQLVVVTGLLIMMLIPVGIIFGRTFTKPILKLHEAARQIGLGDMDYKIEVKTGDEIEELSDSFRDMITNIKGKQKELEETRLYAENIISSMVDTLIVINPDGTIKNVNRATLDLLGYAEDELIGKDIRLIIEEEEEEEEEEETLLKGTRLKELIKKGTVRNFDMVYRTKTGDRIPVSFSGSAMRDKEGKLVGIVGVARDIRQLTSLINDLKKSKAELENLSRTLEKKVEERTREVRQSQEATLNILEDLQESYQRLKEAQIQLSQSEKLASLGRLVSDMAHEINNPLMVISGRAQLSLMEDLKNKQVKENLDIIVEQCQRARDIIQRLLIFSRPSKGELREIDINESLEFVIKLIEHQYSLIDVKIVKKYAPSLPKIKIDEKQIHEVFMNLLNNSADAMPKGGTITVSTSKENNYIRIDFKDTGRGMSEEDMKNIFDPFFTTKEHGTGLGLSICYGIIKANSGEIRYESKLGKGTTATISLPIEEVKA